VRLTQEQVLLQASLYCLRKANLVPVSVCVGLQEVGLDCRNPRLFESTSLVNRLVSNIQPARPASILFFCSRMKEVRGRCLIGVEGRCGSVCGKGLQRWVALACLFTQALQSKSDRSLVDIYASSMRDYALLPDDSALKKVVCVEGGGLRGGPGHAVDSLSCSPVGTWLWGRAGGGGGGGVVAVGVGVAAGAAVVLGVGVVARRGQEGDRVRKRHRTFGACGVCGRAICAVPCQHGEDGQRAGPDNPSGVCVCDVGTGARARHLGWGGGWGLRVCSTLWVPLLV
jgi:hypothetical protein